MAENNTSFSPKGNPLAGPIELAAHAEGMAYAKYTIFAEFLKELGYTQASEQLNIFAKNEKEHLEQWLLRLGKLDQENGWDLMQNVIDSENKDASVMYPLLVKLAKSVQNKDIEDLAQHLQNIEEHHREMMSEIVSGYSGTPFTKDTKYANIWICPHCGNFYYSYEEIPSECPVCGHAGSEYYKEE